MREIFSLSILLASLAFAAHADNQYHNPQPFGVWLNELKQEAKQKGVSDAVIRDALTDIEPVARIIRLDRKQPESTLSFSQYRAKVINQTRIDKGRELRRKHADLLEEVSAKYGVQPEFIVALWGIETNYGSNTGGFSVPEALATLAYDGRRSAYFRKELFAALQIIDEGHIAAYDMQGSWAGAMGQCQFMPSSFNRFAVDYNGDGKRDIWNSLPDVFGSIANYLSESGWKANEPSALAVKLPANFNKDTADIDVLQTITELKKRGVTLADGSPLPASPAQGYLMFVEPNDQLHPHIIYTNYKTTLKWNRSRYFATAVSILAQEIKQGEL